MIIMNAAPAIFESMCMGVLAYGSIFISPAPEDTKGEK